MAKINLQDFLCDMKIDGKKPFRALSNELWSKVPFWVPTGAISLDRAIQNAFPDLIGGIPHTRIIEIFGMESSGKSSLVDSIMKNFQKGHDGYVFLCDAEHAHEEDRLIQMGIIAEDIVFIERDKYSGGVSDDVTLEDFFEYTIKALKAVRSQDPDTPALVVLDSLAMIDTEAQKKAQGEDRNLKMNENVDKAKIMSSRFGSFASSMVANNATLIVVNQLREKPGVMFGDPRYTPGGNMLRYLASVRIGLAKKELIKAKDDIFDHDHNDPVGILVEFKIVKNKVAPPFRTGTFPLMFDDRGIWSLRCLWDLFMSRKEKLPYLQQSGSWFSWKNERLGQGEAKALKALYDNPKILAEMEAVFFNRKDDNKEDIE